MAARIVEQILVRLGLDKREFTTGAAEAKAESRSLVGELNNVRSSSDLMTGALQSAGILGMAYLAKEAAGTVYEMGRMGAGLLRMETAFRDLSSQAGGSADDILAALRRATDGTVADAEIIAAANRGILLGLGANAEQWEQLAEVARYRSRAMGISMTQALDDIVTGIGRESRMILDNLGIIIDVESATTEYAAALGKTAEELTAAERKQALLNTVIEDGQAKISAAGGIARDAADEFAELDTQIANLKASIATGIAPALASGLSDLNENITDTATGVATLRSLFEGSLSVAQAWSILWLPAAERQAALARALGLVSQSQQAANTDAARWTALAGEYASQTQAAAGAVDDLSGATRQLGLIGSVMAYGETLRGMVPAAFTEALEYYNQKGQSMWSDFIHAGVDAWAGVDDAADTAIASWDSGWDSLRSTVEAALQGTVVTAEDLAAAAAGNYVDKWDENIRRLNAIAERGFAELSAHPDWAALLEIPPDILASSEEQLKAWAAGMAKKAPPALFDIDQAVAIVEEYVAQQAAHEALIEAVTQRYAEKHGLSVGAAQKRVGKALGGSEEAGQAAAEELMVGFTRGMKDASPATTFAAQMNADIKAQAALLKATGISLWLAAEVGIKQQMEDSNYVLMFATILAPVVAKLLGSPYGSGGTP